MTGVESGSAACAEEEGKVGDRRLTRGPRVSASRGEREGRGERAWAFWWAEPLAGPSEGGEASRPRRGNGPRPDPGVVSPFFSFLLCFLFPKHFPNRTFESN